MRIVAALGEFMRQLMRRWGKPAPIMMCLIGAALCATASASQPLAPATAPTWIYRVIAEYPHDPSSFTEGLAMLDGHLLESTGRYGESRLLIYDLKDGRLLKSRALDQADFGEGVVAEGGRIVQLTWKSGIGYVYDLDLHTLGGFPLATEGWGLTYDGHSLIRSDGSSTLRYLDSVDYRESRALIVHDGEMPIRQINELEWAQGLIYANVWQTDRIAVIDPADGHVVAWLDLSALKARFAKPVSWDGSDDVLNGIAFDPRSGHFYVTGKCWPKLFEIAVEPKP